MIAAATLTLAASSVIARAQSPAPDAFSTGEQVTRDQGLPDTDFTPDTRKPSAVWRQMQGYQFPTSPEEAEHPEELAVPGTATRFDTDFFAVGFAGTRFGFAGGSECADPPADPGEAKDCAPRVPVIYRYTDTQVDGQVWEKVELPGGDRPGYVGSIAWDPTGTKALVVGGTGRYPRREQALTAEQIATCDAPANAASRDRCEYDVRLQNDRENGAGSARVWQYDLAGDDWCEYGDDSCPSLPDGMSALTAVGYYPGSTHDLAFAGGMGQIWEWRNGQFTKKVDRNSPSSELSNRGLFSFRVREIRFLRGPSPAAYAVTTGCCAGDSIHNTPRLLAYGGSPRMWHVGNMGWDPFDPSVSTTDIEVATGTDAAYEPRRVNNRPDVPDSFYSFMVTGSNASAVSGVPVSFIASPGGETPGPEGERPSLVTQAYCMTEDGVLVQGFPGTGSQFYIPDQAIEATRESLTTARLVAGDGDVAPSLQFKGEPIKDPRNGDLLRDPNGNLIFPNPLYPSKLVGGPRDQSSALVNCARLSSSADQDGVADWIVGELRSTELPGLGSQGLVFGTASRPIVYPDVVRADPTIPEVTSGEYKPTDPDRLKGWARSQYALLDSYSLNAIDMIGETGLGWAVGDHGGIERLGAVKSSETPPAAPKLGTPRPADLADGSPYDAGRPVSAERASPVPALASRPRLDLSRPRLVPAGSPDPTRLGGWRKEDVSQIAMSRDGSEGWAVGASADAMPLYSKPDVAQTTLYHYDGENWSRCDMVGVPGQLPADPECAAVRALPLYEALEVPNPVSLRSIARVPLERDADPSNDDEFEAVAVGTAHKDDRDMEGRMTILRYRDGRWRTEESGARTAVGSTTPTDIAFTAPDDGWILANGKDLFHFDGHSWVRCPGSGCEDPRGLTTVGQSANLRGLAAAGERLYLFGIRSPRYPEILVHPRGGSWTTDPAGGAYDPGSEAAPDPAKEGVVDSLAVSEAGGTYSGWAVGSFEGGTMLLRLGESGWQPFADAGALADYGELKTSSHVQLTLPGGGEDSAFITDKLSGQIFGFDGERWRLVAAQRPPNRLSEPDGDLSGVPQALAPDGEGGFWVAIRDGVPGTVDDGAHDYFFHYTDHPLAPVFSEAPSPLHGGQTQFTGLTGQPDGTVWAATDSDTLYRYDRVGGWERVRVLGWDPGNVVTRPSEMHALAVNPDGQGLVVGKGGRIADISSGEVRLDDAAGALCGADIAGPCGTSRDLRSVAVAPGGSALAGGDALTVLWRPENEGFRAIDGPEADAHATITGLTMPTATSAWLTTDSGLIFSGTLEGQSWRWDLENITPTGRVIGVDDEGNVNPLTALAVEESGHGYAVGARGLILERTENEEQPWRRVPSGFLDHLTTVTLLPGDEHGGALIGGRNGVVLTGNQKGFEVARPADFFGPGYGQTTGPVVGLAALPGDDGGETEAWVALAGETGAHYEQEQSRGVSRLLHYASDPDDPVLEPEARAVPLADTPPPQPGDLSFAAFGKSDCRLAVNPCHSLSGSTAEYEVIAERVASEIATRGGRPGGPRFSLMTGDGVDQPDPVKYRRWNEFVGDPLQDAGVPVFGAVGSQDLASPGACVLTFCRSTSEFAPEAGDNTAWRAGFSGTPAPWGQDDPASTGSLLFRPVPETGSAAHVGASGAQTHYAFDVIDEEAGDRALARIVVLDNSFGSLAASDPTQDPVQAGGGQTLWLEDVLCASGRSTTGEECTREPGEPAIVLLTTPTYSYGPNDPRDTSLAIDATVLETLLLRYGVSVVVSGRLGWNGRYWATAAGVHEPCPGGAYQEQVPEPGARECDQLPASSSEAPPIPVDPADAAGGPGETGSVLPFVIASSAGGKLAEEAGDAGQGFWHGYTNVRIAEDGDPSKLVVEQRPIFDWVDVSASDHVVRAGRKLELQGVGREPIGASTAFINGGSQVTRYDEISTPAITHRFELLEADPARPWMPKLDSGDSSTEMRSAASERLGEEDPCGPYLCLDPKVATLDDQSGQVKAGKGNYPRTYAIASLSVGGLSATYPLVFEPRASFRAPIPPPVRPPGAPPVPPTPTEPPIPNQPVVDALVPPVLPTVTAAQPPAPPIPPTPPPAESQAPLDLNLAPTALDVNPPTAVSQPPTPPVNPAPPSGARREARQRQAAAQKSGADLGDEGAESGREAADGGDLADGPASPGGSPMTRHDFTAVAHREQPSAWARDALVGGGIGIAALILALGLRTAGPTPRRRDQDRPAPAYSARRGRS